jgi:uncharacterized cupin superfamily protein
VQIKISRLLAGVLIILLLASNSFLIFCIVNSKSFKNFLIKEGIMKIKVEKLTDEQIEKRGIKSWSIWEKAISRFDWYYDSIEECLLLEGKVVVETADGEKVEFEKGDFVTFPKGLSCIWDIKEAVKKHYNFK